MLNGRSLSHSTVRDDLSFEALQDDWASLFQRAAIKTPFLRYSWMRLCWERHRRIRSTRLLIIVVREDGKVVLIAPFLTRPSLVIYKAVSFLDSLTPQYNDVLVEQSAHASEYLDYLWKALRSVRRVRALNADWVRADSFFVRPLLEAKSASKATSHRATEIDLCQFDGWRGYIHSRSQKLRSDHGRQLRNLGKRGLVKFEASSGGPFDDTGSSRLKGEVKAPKQCH